MFFQILQQEGLNIEEHLDLDLKKQVTNIVCLKCHQNIDRVFQLKHYFLKLVDIGLFRLPKAGKVPKQMSMYALGFMCWMTRLLINQRNEFRAKVWQETRDQQTKHQLHINEVFKFQDCRVELHCWNSVLAMNVVNPNLGTQFLVGLQTIWRQILEITVLLSRVQLQLVWSQILAHSQPLF